MDRSEEALLGGRILYGRSMHKSRKAYFNYDYSMNFLDHRDKCHETINWGCLLSYLGTLLLSGASLTGNHDGDGVALLILLAGGVLAYYGSRHRSRTKETASIALQMLRQDGKIDASKRAVRMGLLEVGIRPMLAESQRKEIIPFKAEIV